MFTGNLKPSCHLKLEVESWKDGVLIQEDCKMEGRCVFLSSYILGFYSLHSVEGFFTPVLQKLTWLLQVKEAVLVVSCYRPCSFEAAGGWKITFLFLLITNCGLLHCKPAYWLVRQNLWKDLATSSIFINTKCPCSTQTSISFQILLQPHSVVVKALINFFLVFLFIDMLTIRIWQWYCTHCADCMLNLPNVSGTFCGGYNLGLECLCLVGFMALSIYYYFIPSKELFWHYHLNTHKRCRDNNRSYFSR